MCNKEIEKKKSEIVCKVIGKYGSWDRWADICFLFSNKCIRKQMSVICSCYSPS